TVGERGGRGSGFRTSPRRHPPYSSEVPFTPWEIWMSLFRPSRLLRFLITSFRCPLPVALSPTRSGGGCSRPVRPALAPEPLEDRTLLSGTGGALGVAGAFNVFVLGQVTQSYTDSEGRVAAGGDVRLTSYGIGAALPNSAGQRDDLAVGGRLTYDQGQVFNGNIVYGGTAAVPEPPA